jgi:DNA-binding ferritin-like protein (Dps family)
MKKSLPLKRATTLREALNVLDPERALTTPEELDSFFVQRTESPIDRMEVLLEDSRQPETFLFTGHRGSGKSTELSRLAQRLGNDFRVIRYSVKDTLNLFALTHVDVLFSMAVELIKVATAEDVDVRRDVLENVWAFTREITRETELKTSDSADLRAKLNMQIVQLSAKYRTEDVTRSVVREQMGNRISDLLENIELLGMEIEAKVGAPPIIIIEDLDKTDLGTAHSLFYDHSEMLSEPPLYMIYTFPMPLRHTNEYPQVRQTFTNAVIFPNIKTRYRDGTPFEAGLRATKQIITNRIDDSLITGDALDRLAELSSGIPRELLILTRQACLSARVNKDDKITKAAVEDAATEQRKEYQVILSKEQKKLLKNVHETNQINNDDAHRTLLHNLSLLEYQNGEVWYDVHPLAQHLIDDAN